jgi:hypothetical protein
MEQVGRGLISSE